MSVTIITICLVAFAPETKQKHIPFYKSTSKILLTPSSTSGIAYQGAHGMNQNADLSRSWFADIVILQELIRSEELMTRVAAAAETDLNWETLRSMTAVEPMKENGVPRFGLVKMFTLSVTAQDPVQSEKLTRLVTEEFVAYVQDLSAREFANTRRFIEELVLEAEQHRTAAEVRLAEIREKYSDAPSEEALMSEERTLESELQAAKRDAARLRAEVASVRDYLDGRTDSPPWTILEQRDGSLASLESNVAERKLELMQAREIYTDKNQNVVLAKSRLQRSEELYDEALKDYVNSLYHSKSSELQQRLRQTQEINRQLNTLMASKMTKEDLREVRKLERQMTQWDENHLSLTQQLYQARVVEQSSKRQGSVNVLEQPRQGSLVTPQSGRNLSVGASKKKKLAMAVPFCLALGIAAAFLREFLSASMKLRPRIEEALELPVIAVIPSSPSELTVDWETFKRPNAARLSELVRAHSEPEKVPVASQNDGNGWHGTNGHRGNGHSNGHHANGHRTNGNGKH